jgi:hypothetical protein
MNIFKIKTPREAAKSAPLGLEGPESDLAF